MDMGKSMAPHESTSPGKTDPGFDRCVHGSMPRIAGEMIFALLLMALVLTSIFMIRGRSGDSGPALFGYRFYIVLSGSMSPTFNAGSLILVGPADPEEIRPGDIITFRGPRSDAVTTHRVVEIEHEGGLKFVTRGDANKVSDFDPVPAQNLVGKVYGYGYVPLLGRLLAFARTRPGLICLVFVPGALVIAGEVRSIYRYLERGKCEK